MLACSRLQRRHPFAEEPQSLVELDILIDAVDGAVLRASRANRAKRD